MDNKPAIYNLSEWIRAHPPGKFKPVPHMSIVGNMLTWYWSDEEGYAEQVNVDGKHVGTVIRSFKTKEAVGVKINMESVGVNINVKPEEQ